MKIGEDHWLEGVIRKPLSMGGAMNTRRFLVEHASEGWADAIEVMKSRGVSCHFTIQRDGTIIQSVPCNHVAYHAGQSKWRDPNTRVLYDGLNSCAIGIEYANIMDLVRDKYPSTMGVLAGHPIPRVHLGGKDWEVYPEVQIAVGEALSKALVEHYHLDDVVTHAHISPGRKRDAGPAFPLERIRKACGYLKPLPAATF